MGKEKTEMVARAGKSFTIILEWLYSKTSVAFLLSPVTPGLNLLSNSSHPDKVCGGHLVLRLFLYQSGWSLPRAGRAGRIRFVGQQISH